MSKSRLAAFGLAALLLAACGPVHPGAAAVVDGTRISMSDAEDLAQVYCAVSLVNAQQQGTDEIDNTLIRRQAVSDLMAGTLADQIARERGFEIEVPALTAADRDQIGELFGDDADAVFELIDRNQRTNAVALELARESGADVTDEDAALQAGHELLARAADEADISVDPRFGLSDAGRQIAETGSLSVPSVSLDATASEDRPAALKCTA